MASGRQIDNDIAAFAEAQRQMQERERVIEGVRNLDQDMQLAVADALRLEILTQRPKNSTELWHSIKAKYNYAIPYRATEEGFQSPFEWYSDVFFGKVSDSVALASRGSGKTLLGTMLHNDFCNYYPGHKSIHAGGTLSQAQVASEYLEGYWDDPVLNYAFDGRPGKFSARYKNKSRWAVATGSMKGVSGKHPYLLSLDEIEFWPLDGLNQTWEVPVVGPYGHKIWTAFSTRQRSFGCMNWLVDHAQERGIKLYTWTIFEIMQPCRTCKAIDENPDVSGERGDDLREQSCPLWRYCHGERAKKSTGWIPLEGPHGVIEKIRKLGGINSPECQTQALCLRPSSHGLVLHNFTHEYRPDGNYTRWKYQAELPYYIAYDPAEGKKSVMYFVQIHDGAIFIFDEIINPSSSDPSVDKEALYAYITKYGMKDPAVVVTDPRRPDASAMFKRGSITKGGLDHRYNAICPPQDEKSGTQLIAKGISALRMAICDGNRDRGLFVNPTSCPGCVTAIKEHHYPTDMNNKILSDNPDQEYKDEIDPLRYFVQYKNAVLDFGGAGVRWL